MAVAKKEESVSEQVRVITRNQKAEEECLTEEGREQQHQQHDMN
jgi:hypothetical protein